ncbi:unnamed protein product [Ixodes persulcatus]
MDSKRHENKRRKEKENSSKDSESKGEKRRVLRHEWSQTRSEVSATLDVGFPVDSNQVTLKCTDGECSITLPDGRHWECELFAPVVGEYTSLIHKPKKVVVKMVKKDPSINWCQLEKSDEPLRPDVPTQDDKEENPTTELTNPKYDYYESGVSLNHLLLNIRVSGTTKGQTESELPQNKTFHVPSAGVITRQNIALHVKIKLTAQSGKVGSKSKLKPARKVARVYWGVGLKGPTFGGLSISPEPMAAPSNTWMPVSRSASLATPPPEALTPIPLAAAPERAGCSEPPTLDSSAGDASSLRSSTLKQEEVKKQTCVVPTQRTPPDGGAERSPVVLEPEVALGYTGLDNLGNTCFMNSVLQCLANTREFRDYFLGGVFQGEINTENPLGMRGELAVAFAVLLRWLWSGAQRSYAPSRLKSLISVKAPQFTGFAQHDAQEFMAFLLDGLHEDLNRIHNKPYVESVDSANRPDEVVAEESWSRYKLRNDSIVVDLFQGQYKSTVICPECQKVSINFDPFLYLSVPLPKKQKIFVVHFYRWDPDQVPIKLRLRLNQDARVEDLKDEIFKKTHVSPRNLRLLEVYNRKIYKVFNRDDDSLMDITPKDLIFAFEILGRDVAREKVVEVAVVQRLLMPHAATTCASCGVAKLEALKRCTRCLRVGYCNRTCQTNHWHQHKSVCKFVPELVGLPFVLSLPQSQATYANLCRLMEAYSRQDSFFFSFSVSLMFVLRTCLTNFIRVSLELKKVHILSPSPTLTGLNRFALGGTGNRADLSNASCSYTVSFSFDLKVSSFFCTAVSGFTLRFIFTSSPSLSLVFKKHHRTGTEPKQNTKLPNRSKLFNYRAQTKPEQNRRLVNPNGNNNRSEGGPMFGVTSVVPYAESCPSKVDFVFEERGESLPLFSRYQILPVECVYNYRLLYTLCSSSPAFIDFLYFISELEKHESNINTPCRHSASSSVLHKLQPTVIALQKKKHRSLNLKKKKPSKLGTPVMSLSFSGNEPLDLSRVYYLAMDWRNDQRQGSYVLVESKEVVGSFSLLKQPAIHSYETSKEDGISLDQCLRLFTEPEVLSPQEAWYCPSCKEHRQATKELSLWRLPPVLIIQLKRFSFTRSIFRDKIDKMVDFPINGLDVGPYYCGPACESGGPQPVYDLFAVINHHGGMLGGHYTAFGRCTDATDTRLSEVGWRLFDDSRVNAVSDARVATSAAYMLFYRRRNAPFELSPCGAPAWRPRATTAPSQKLLKDRENLLDQEFSAQNDANNNRCHYGVATPDDASVDMDSPD